MLSFFFGKCTYNSFQYHTFLHTQHMVEHRPDFEFTKQLKCPEIFRLFCWPSTDQWENIWSHWWHEKLCLRLFDSVVSTLPADDRSPRTFVRSMIGQLVYVIWTGSWKFYTNKEQGLHYVMTQSSTETFSTEVHATMSQHIVFIVQYYHSPVYNFPFCCQWIIKSVL